MDIQPTILIVDDELGPRESLRMILKPHYRVLTASDGRSALETVYSQAVDVVTLDLKMPGIGGVEILKAIKQFDPQVEVIIVTGYGNLKSAIDGIRYGVVDYILKPFNVFDILLAIGKGLERRRMRSQLHGKLSSLDPGLDVSSLCLSLLGDPAALSGRPGDRPAGDGERYLDFLKVLACTLENKDEYTHGHSGRVTYYSSLIADRLGMPDEGKKHLQVAAFLHDIGKLGISNSVVGKEDRLSEQETVLIQEHPEKGARLIEPLGVPREILDIIRHHHEHYNGSGYPYRLKGESIPRGARIVAIADAYDAMSSHRPYRRALSEQAIRAEFVRCSGRQFCPETARVFLGILDAGELSADGGLPCPPAATLSLRGGSES